MNKEQLMLLEIEKLRRLPIEVKRTIHLDIFQNLLSAIVFEIYFCVINFLYYNFEANIFENILKYFALSLILITVILFEVSYRKSNKKTLLAGIEFLLMGIICLYIPYIFIYMSKTIRLAVMIIPGIIVIYSLIKSFIIFKSKKFIYQNNLSDVKEIVKDDRKTYIDEESTKTYKQKIEEEEFIKQVIIKEQVIRRQNRAHKKNI